MKENTVVWNIYRDGYQTVHEAHAPTGKSIGTLIWDFCLGFGLLVFFLDVFACVADHVFDSLIVVFSF